jgi:hypothetical protein
MQIEELDRMENSSHNLLLIKKVISYRRGMCNAINLELNPFAIIEAYSNAFIECSDPSRGTSIFLNLARSDNNYP